MFKFPHYTQHDTMDCGPTCLRIIAKYYGKTYTLQTLRDNAHRSEEHTSELQSHSDLVCRLLLEKKKKQKKKKTKHNQLLLLYTNPSHKV